MNTSYNILLVKTFWLAFGTLFIFISYGTVIAELNSRKHEKAFLRIPRPPNSSQIDSLSLNLSYYPATYADDSTHFRSARLVGELRSYTGNWDNLKLFYNDMLLEDAGQVMVLPMELHSNSFNFADDFRTPRSIMIFLRNFNPIMIFGECRKDWPRWNKVSIWFITCGKGETAAYKNSTAVCHTHVNPIVITKRSE